MKALWWKEWRNQRVLAIGVLAIGALGCWAVMQFPWGPSIAINTLLVAPVGALAFGAAAIADERESGTLGLLRRLPVHPLRIWLTKAAFGTVGSWVMLLVLCGVARLSGAAEPAKIGRVAWAVVPLCPLAWAIAAAWSAVLRQAVTAAMAGAGTLIPVEYALTWAFGSFAPFGQHPLLVSNWQTSVGRLVLAGAIALLGYWLYSRRVRIQR